MKRILLAAIWVVIVSVSGTSALGCSYADGSLFPTNYDLVKDADAIVLAQGLALDTPPEDGAPTFFSATLSLRVTEVIKGSFTGNKVRVPTLSSCFGYDYQEAVGMQLLLILNKSDGEWNTSESPIRDFNGQVSGAGGGWETIVRHYVRISRLNDYDQEKAELRGLQAEARRASRSHPAGLDEDIETFFAKPYPTRAYKDLLELFNKGSVDQREDVLWAFVKGKHKEADPLMQSLMRSSEFVNYTKPIAAYVTAMQDYSSIDVIGGAYLGLKNKQTRWPIMWALIELARPQNMGLMLAALKTADIEEAGRMSGWFVRYPDDEATEIMRKLVGTQFDDYRRWELSLSLAAVGDKDVVEYARKTLVETQNIDRRERVSFRGENLALKRGLAIGMLARSPLPEAETFTREVISMGDIRDLADLAEGFLFSLNPNRWNRLREIPNLKAIDEASGHSIKQSLEEMAKQGDPDAKELLSRLN